MQCVICRKRFTDGARVIAIQKFVLNSKIARPFDNGGDYAHLDCVV